MRFLHGGAAGLFAPRVSASSWRCCPRRLSFPGTGAHNSRGAYNERTVLLHVNLWGSILTPFGVLKTLLVPSAVCQPQRTVLAVSFMFVICFAASGVAVPFAAPNPVAAPDTVSYHGVPVGRIWCEGNSRTRDEVIIRELLVQSGEAFDLELIQESERNLRDFSYIGSADIIPHYDPARNLVDLEVRIRDRFPWVVFPSPSLGGGRFDLSFLVANFNFLGRGQAAGIQGEISSDEADTYIVGFEEPRLGGSRWGGAVVGGRQGERGEQFSMVIERPLYSLSTRWAFEFSAFDWEAERSFYEEGVKTSQYYNRSIGGSATATRSIRSENKRLEINLSYRYFDERNEQDEGWAGVIADDKRRATLRLRIGAERFRYVEDTYLFEMGPVEDIKLGPNGYVRLGGALKALGSDRDYPEFGLGFGWFGGAPESGYAHFSLGSDARIDDGDITNHTGSAMAGLFYPIGERNLLSWGLEGRFQARMEDPSQLLLGSGRGLRGYAAQAFDGHRLLRTSIEWRHTVWVTSRMSAGYVIFTDAGSIWESSESISDVPFLISVGTGLRFSVPGLIGGPILRLDFAYGIQDDYFDVSLGL